MCDKITKLASLGKFQWIGMCEHGAVHVHWKAMQVCISMGTFEFLANKAVSEQLPVANYQNDFLLWLGQTAIRLTVQELDEMQNLFSGAYRGQANMALENKNLRSNAAMLH